MYRCNYVLRCHKCWIQFTFFSPLEPSVYVRGMCVECVLKSAWTRVVKLFNHKQRYAWNKGGAVMCLLITSDGQLLYWCSEQPEQSDTRWKGFSQSEGWDLIMVQMGIIVHTLRQSFLEGSHVACPPRNSCTKNRKRELPRVPMLGLFQCLRGILFPRCLPITALITPLASSYCWVRWIVSQTTHFSATQDHLLWSAMTMTRPLLFTTSPMAATLLHPPRWDLMR